MDEKLQPLPGGFSGETFVVESAGERQVVRLYGQRGARRRSAAVEIDAAVLRLVQGLLPVPTVLEVRPPSLDGKRPAVLRTSFLPGVRLDTCLSLLDEGMRATVGRHLGVTLAHLSQIPMQRAGRFVDSHLRIEPWEAAAADLPTWLAHQRSSSALAAWPEDLYQRLREVACAAQSLLAEGSRVCLVHSDFNPKNLLIDPATGALTGLLDWEFAHAGAPLVDLGNLLRFDRAAAFVEGVVEGYLESAGPLEGVAGPDGRRRLLDRARAADLFALVELAGRRGENPVTDRADAQLRSIATAGDPHAEA